MVEHYEAGFALQNVVTEYVTGRLVEIACEELESGNLDLLHRHALIKALAKEYLRQGQLRMILEPIHAQLEARLGPTDFVDIGCSICSANCATDYMIVRQLSVVTQPETCSTS